MIAIEDTVVDLLRLAETPLYSTYRYVARRIGKEPSLPEFLRLVESMLDRRVVRLWTTEYPLGRKEELLKVPIGLEDHYRAVELADNYDPFGLTLSLGDAANPAAPPAWEVDFDFAAGVFELRAPEGEEAAILEQLRRLLPDMRIIERTRQQAQGEVLLSGDVEPQ